MKKLFLLFALVGVVGAASATSLSTKINTEKITFRQDDKKQEPKGHNCSKHEKGKCDHAKGHDCSKHAKGECKHDHKSDGKGHCKGDSTKANCTNKAGDKKACCKPKNGATPAVPPTK